VLGRRLNSGLGHERDMFGALAVAAFAVGRAAAETLAIKLLAAAGAVD
jgi:hypothetical protein